jgi:hypothetical protein
MAAIWQEGRAPLRNSSHSLVSIIFDTSTSSLSSARGLGPRQMQTDERGVLAASPERQPFSSSISPHPAFSSTLRSYTRTMDGPPSSRCAAWACTSRALRARTRSSSCIFGHGERPMRIVAIYHLPHLFFIVRCALPLNNPEIPRLAR